MTQSLIIGLNYENSPYELGGCANDALNYEKRIGRLNGTGNLYAGGICTANTFYREMQSLAANAAKYRMPKTIITFSGHGTQYAHGDEGDGMQEALCFWNGHNIELVPDDVFRAYVRNIPGSVFVVLDSCFSGGMDRDVQNPNAAEWRRKFVQYDETMDVVLPTGFARTPKASTQNKTYWLFACKESEVSWDTGTAGWFTLNFCQVYDAMANRPIAKVMGRTASLCKPDQTPVYNIEGGTSLKHIF